MLQLLPKRGRTVKAHLAAQVRQKPDAQRFSVEISGEARQMGLQNRLRERAQRRVDADIHKRGEALPVKLRLRAVNAEGRNQNSGRKGEVCGRKAKAGSPVRAVPDLAAEKLAMAQQAHGLRAFALLKKRPDAGGADDTAVHADLADDIAADAKLPAQRKKLFRASLAAAAKAEVMAADQVAGMERMKKIICDEGLPGHVHHRTVKVDEDDLLDGDSPYPKEETERLVAETTAAAVAALAELPGDTAFLSALARKLVGRTV